VALLAYGHQIVLIEEQIRIALVILDVVNDWRIGLLAFAYERPAASDPLAGVIVPEQYAPAEAVPSLVVVETAILLSFYRTWMRFSHGERIFLPAKWIQRTFTDKLQDLGVDLAYNVRYNILTGSQGPVIERR